MQKFGTLGEKAKCEKKFRRMVRFNNHGILGLEQSEKMKNPLGMILSSIYKYNSHIDCFSHKRSAIDPHL